MILVSVYPSPPKVSMEFWLSFPCLSTRYPVMIDRMGLEFAVVCGGSHCKDIELPTTEAFLIIGAPGFKYSLLTCTADVTHGSSMSRFLQQ